MLMKITMNKRFLLKLKLSFTHSYCNTYSKLIGLLRNVNQFR